MKTYTVAIIKPDAVKASLTGIIIDRICRQTGLVIEFMSFGVFNDAELFYGRQHKDKPYFERLIDHMISGPVIIMVLSSRNDPAFEEWRKELKEIRKSYLPTDYVGPRNIVHGSDSEESVIEELKFVKPLMKVWNE